MDKTEYHQVAFCNDRNKRGFDVIQNGFWFCKFSEKLDKACPSRRYIGIVLNVIFSHVLMHGVKVTTLEHLSPKIVNKPLVC